MGEGKVPGRVRADRATRGRGDDRGAAAVEFALLLPVVFLIIAGIVDFGTVFFTKIELTNAAREGARAAVVTGTSVANVQARATAAAPGVNGFAAPAPSVCPSAGLRDRDGTRRGSCGVAAAQAGPQPVRRR